MWQTEISKKFKETITELYNEEYGYFGAGGVRGLETLAALAVLELKQELWRLYADRQRGQIPLCACRDSGCSDDKLRNSDSIYVAHF